MQLRQDGNGLPIIEWRKENGYFKGMRCCRIEPDRNGTLQFVHENTGEATWRTTSLLGGMAGVGGFIVGIVLAGLIGTPIGGHNGFGPLNLVVILGLGFGVGFAAWRYAAGWAGEATHKSESRPWEELQAFVVTDDQTFLGRPKTVALPGGGTRPAEPVSLIVADFGSATLSMVVAAEQSSQEKMGAYHMLLTREFIERRGDYLKRLAASQRQARNEAAGQREKII